MMYNVVVPVQMAIILGAELPAFPVFELGTISYILFLIVRGDTISL